ncbi:hypothetical protein WKW47_07340 [Staphylococcus nepalensis]|uniref:hypothetical protein n=1 Tax=Staphylococcus nepalensis TaxID=214473 RepID=UPI003F4979CA
MGVEIEGLELIEDDIYKLYSRKSIDKAETKAIKAGGNFLRNKVATSLNHVRDTGELAIGTDIKAPHKMGDEMIASIYWRGNHQTLAYINEMGHHLKDGTFFKPRGAGFVNTTLRYYKDQYYEIIKREMNK